ncbi:photosynthetic complex assembly protein PuhC [Piscinibacter sakaiensis]|uniref:Photosynthetic complex assembly protein PuhC n=1 Tax=Piscinibacter sakaiensis TaxID=1547922 RepID=A0A0K8NWR3_PISS1|nr:photosynthetic complex assembly protein PuhC [Piscinibacter sakaiensis]GAP34380.1 hypothetical protein ISF6_4555 [Piscinibacter sakaiensis]
MADTLRPTLPAPLLLGAGGVVAVAVLAAALAGPVGSPRPATAPATAGPAADGAEAVRARRALRVVDQPDGGVELVDAADGRVIHRIAPGEDGFARSALRGLARERLRHGLGPAAPFELAATRDGRLVLGDPLTGRRIDLASFGATNAAAFARLLGPPEPRP